MKKATLLFLIKKDADKISEICLAMKKRGFGKGRWNGAGGKVEEGENFEKAAIRETEEEIGVSVKKILKVAELVFEFPSKPEWNQVVNAFFSESWEGKPEESEEMSPGWFRVEEIPFVDMWPDDVYWLPLVIDEKKLKAKFVFGENDVILHKQVEEVAGF